MFTTSTDGGGTWAPFRQLEQPGDQGYYSAPAISPDGTDVCLVYNAFTTPFHNNTTEARWLVGVVLHAEVAGGVVGRFTQMHRGAVGDPRSSAQNNLAGEFLGDYVYAAATRAHGVAVWNDARNGGVCSAINTYRQALHDAVVAGTTLPTAPAVQSSCPVTFGDSDIFGWSGAVLTQGGENLEKGRPVRRAGRPLYLSKTFTHPDARREGCSPDSLR